MTVQWIPNPLPETPGALQALAALPMHASPVGLGQPPDTPAAPPNASVVYATVFVLSALTWGALAGAFFYVQKES